MRKSTFRRRSEFVRNPSGYSNKLTTNGKYAIMRRAEEIEQRTKPRGGRSGALGLTGLAVLRALLFRLTGGSLGLCEPSYAQIAKTANVARPTVAKALKALAAYGLLKVVRRLTRKLVEICGEMVLRAVQATNLYVFGASSLNGEIRNQEKNIGLADRGPDGRFASKHPVLPSADKATISLLSALAKFQANIDARKGLSTIS